MNKINGDSSRPSSATHHSTQASTTLNRRYVRKPANLMIEEAARGSKTGGGASRLPSRLVNMRVSSADLEAAKAREEAERMAENARISQNMTVYPAMVEFGSEPAAIAAMQASMAAAQAAEAQAAMPAASTMAAGMMPGAMSGAMPEAMTIPSMPMTEAPKPTTPTINPSDLAMSIAADYAAASLSATTNEIATELNLPENEDSVNAIARAASDAIASIRTATAPDQVLAQVASLKAFADNIKSSPDLPEMRELGNTIDKFVQIAMKSDKLQEEAQNADTGATTVTLSPKVTRAAAKVTKSSAKTMAAHSKAIAAKNQPARRPVAPTMRRSVGGARRTSPEELKNRAIEQAMKSVATMNEPSRTVRKRPPVRVKRGKGVRFAIAFACAAACVGGIVHYVTSNMPDISVRVAAIQTGIQAKFPSYIPRDYTLGQINSEDGKISMEFNGPDKSSFTLIEEKSSWDSSALLRNFVEPTWEQEYTTTHEQGITIYIANLNSDAVWVNGGVLYKIVSKGNTLTKKQVRSIVTSL